MNIKDIKPYPKNAKRHPAKQIKQVAESIREFGFNQPIVVDKNGVIIKSGIIQRENNERPKPKTI